MRRGTKVGQAYVSVTADGSGINREISEAFEDVDFDEVAGKFDRQFADRIREQLRAVDKDFSNVLDRMGGAIENDKRITQGVQGILANAFDLGALDELFDEVGRRAGVSIGDGMDKELRKSVLDSLENSLQNAALSGSIDLTGLVRGVQGAGGELDLPGSLLDKAVEDMRRLVEETRRENEKMYAELFRVQEQGERANFAIVERFTAKREALIEKSNAAILKDEEALRRAQQKLHDRLRLDFEKGQRANVAIVERFLAKREALIEKSNDAILKDDEALRRSQQKLFDKLQKEQTEREAEEAKKRNRLHDELWAARRATAKAHAKYLDSLERGVTDKFGNRVSRNAGGRNGIASVVGGLLGSGSRNNFLNLFGKSIENVIGLTLKLGSTASKTFSIFREGFSKAAEGASLFQKIGSGFSAVGASGAGGISAAFSSLAKSGPAAAAAIAIVALAMSVLVSVAGALLGILTALVSTIASALVGALAVLGPTLGAVTVAAGLLTAAFTSMTDRQQRLLKDAFVPLKEEMTGLGQLMLREMVPAFSTWSQNLQRALYLVTPLAAVMGQAFAQAGNTITRSLSGPGFQNLSVALGTFLPSIITRLSSALGGFLNGVAGMFAVLLPYVDRFSGYLADVADRFSRWANSAQGRNAIEDFVDRALESLRSLWNFTKEFFGFLSDLIFSPEAQDAGNTIFDGLTRAFAGFRRAIANGDLERWFNDAVGFAKDLGRFMRGLGDVIGFLYSSGVLAAVGDSLATLGRIMSALVQVTTWAIDIFQDLPAGLQVIISPIGTIIEYVDELVDVLDKALIGLDRLLGGGRGSWGNLPKINLSDLAVGGAGALGAGSMFLTPPSMNNLLDIGSNALDVTSVDSGGRRGPWKNPYVEFANSLIKEGPTVSQQIRAAIRGMNAEVAKALRLAAVSAETGVVRSTILDAAQAMRQQGRDLAEAAQNAINDAARNLAGADSQREANKALRELSRAQAAMRRALAAQERLNKAAKVIQAQRVVRGANVARLLAGFRSGNFTLAEYARAREIIAGRIEAAQDKLAEAIADRDSFRTAVTDSIRTFGSLVTAQARTINGVEQALTATDVTDSLRERLERIKKFQDDLRLLLAQGLSDEAYKQLVEAGVEGGAATAAAIAAGGPGAVAEVNSLVAAIGSAGSALGDAASSRLYQAGVDAAQGLINGLESLDAQLEAAAVRLGNTIANSIRTALGIRSPSRRMIAEMESVGDGMVVGLNNQHVKVGSAAARLAGQIAVSPAAAAASVGAATTGVSGNEPKVMWTGNIVTPTEDPHAVAMETLNELAGRL